MNIIQREEKKVEYTELIYDLIFVYMIGRDNSLLEDIQNGFVRPEAFVAYILCTLSIIQIWNFTTFYINMFGRNGIREHVFLFLNMYLMYFIGESTRTDWYSYQAQYHIAWGLILTNIGLQYLLELRNHQTDVWNRGVIRRMSIAIFSEAVLVFIAAVVPPGPGVAVSYAAIAVGILLTAIGRGISVGGQVDFLHLTERAMLYVVFSFGEMVITIALYFTGGGKFDVTEIYFSAMTFLVAVGLFLSYEVIYDHLIDREGAYGGMLYLLIHIFLIFAVNLITVSFEFVRNDEIDVMPKMLLLSCSLAGYFLCLFLLNGHFKIRCGLDRRFISKVSVLTGVFLVLMGIFCRRMYINVMISVVYAFSVLLILYRMKAVQDDLKNKTEDAGI